MLFPCNSWTNRIQQECSFVDFEVEVLEIILEGLDKKEEGEVEDVLDNVLDNCAVGIFIPETDERTLECDQHEFGEN